MNNQRVLQDFWNDDDVHDLPYRRGFLLATNWNALIRSASDGASSLDNAMLDMLHNAQKERPEITAELIDKYISRYANRSILPDVRRYIEDGELIAPDKQIFGSHVRREMIEVPLFELGLDLETLRNKKVIAGVVDGSAAYRAGLRNGQVVVKRSPIYLGDVTKPIELTIKDGESEKVIKFFPASQNTISVPQFKLRPDITDKERTETLRWLGAVSSSSN